jgi:hypothetical protein
MIIKKVQIFIDRLYYRSNQVMRYLQCILILYRWLNSMLSRSLHIKVGSRLAF